MISAATHRRLAREYTSRADRAVTRKARLKYLQLAVRNRMRAQIIEAESAPIEEQTRRKKTAA